jgi:aspartyl/asparaginyl beta-hydroxylase (cupin superfamily)
MQKSGKLCRQKSSKHAIYAEINRFSCSIDKKAIYMPFKSFLEAFP